MSVQSDQLVNEKALKQLGSSARESFLSIMDRLANELESPLRLSASFPVADSKLNFAPSIVPLADGANRSMAPISSQVYNLSASTIDFQTQATTGATFVISWPVTNTVGRYRRFGFTLLGNGSIQVLISSEATTQAALTNAGTLFVKSGTALGYIDLICTDTLGKFKTVGSVTSIIENLSIYRFGSGSGGGSGTGDANAFETYLALRLDESFYQFCMPVIFSSTADTQISSATAAYNLVDSTYDFSAGAQQLTTIQLFTTSFLNLVDESRQLELHAEWFDSASRDDAATYEVSLNGGGSWQSLSMGRVLSTQKFLGKILLDNPVYTSIFSQLTNNSSKELNATTQQAIAQSFTVATKSAAGQIQLSLNKNGSPTGSYTIKLSSDTSGAPGTVLYSQTALCSSLSAGANAISLSGFKSILTAGTYWISIETDATYKSGFVTTTTSLTLATNSAISGYVNNGTTWSTLAGSGMYYILSGHIYDLRVRITSSAGSKKLKAFGIFYDEQVGAIEEGLLLQQSFIFSGDTNQTNFVVTRFTPDSRRLRIYDIISGQTYLYPAFNIDGKTISFASGTFQSPGQQMNLLFDQSQGVGFDYSDLNASLLTANHLGSNDNTIDRSSSGRGILLRNAAGVLKEIWLDSNNNLNITNFKG